MEVVVEKEEGRRGDLRSGNYRDKRERLRQLPFAFLVAWAVNYGIRSA